MTGTEDTTNEPTAEELAYAQEVAMGNIIVEPKAPELEVEVPDEVDEPVVAEKKDDGTIPRARFNEVNEELKALKEKLVAIETVKPAPVEQQPSEYELLEAKRDELEEKADALFFEGELEQRKPLLKEIRAIDKALAKAEILHEVNQQTTQRSNANSQAEVAAKAYKAFPFLNPADDSFDSDAVAAINARQQVLMKEGQSLAVALANAVDEKGPKFAKLLGLGETTEVANKGDEVRAAREKAALEKAAATSVEQPGLMPNKSDKSEFKSIAATMTAKQILALPEAEREKAMGNII